MWRPLAALAARGPGGGTGGARNGPGIAARAALRGRAALPVLGAAVRRARGGGGGGSGGQRGRWGPGGGTGPVMAAIGAAFVWDGRRIEEEEMRRTAQELQQLENPEEFPEREQPWELIMEREHFRLWRRPIPGSTLFQYRVFGSYTDVTPRQFFNVQLDTEYRKKWDSLVLKLDVVERDPASGSEYPMYSRDYVYVRRYSVDSDRNLMVLVSRAVEHPGIPEDPEHVRVRSYESHMVIRPHRGFDENGFDYLLTYSDNPQTVFPRYCLSWMVSSGMPEFLEKLHSAALKAKKMELEVRDYLSPGKSPEPRGAARLEYA
ncbi:stAR-related lipid transfer protein 7, mitochondrial isoform X2 [Poecile atricapillus]|uniref:stAR-related lipid transfer protein 7, mitochondrial isoform X2 n=1 Tax=Poecile atricapillus TaxID=48891 RepID=UPI002739B140|nr:stAR-related lipid transfer protein 7, mitochondrial isoform X2 [Poecile atricapillus]